LQLLQRVEIGARGADDQRSGVAREHLVEAIRQERDPRAVWADLWLVLNDDFRPAASHIRSGPGKADRLSVRVRL
jgi:hypothetical protein